DNMPQVSKDVPSFAQSSELVKSPRHSGQVTHLQAQNDLFRAENDKIKQHYKELYDSIKITRAKHIEQNNNKDALVDGKEHDDDIHKSVSSDIHSSSSGFRDLNAEFEECTNKISNGVNAASSSVSTAGHNFINSTNDFSAATRSMTRTVRDQGGISQMFNEDFHTCMFACFLSQEEPKRVHQVLKDPSWIEAMQEELLQFKMQKVWILVDLPYEKKAIGTK
nr:putative ribonuclease H-like domain-containing protein [Tanacetum cinerariifolium]